MINAAYVQRYVRLSIAKNYRKLLETLIVLLRPQMPCIKASLYHFACDLDIDVVFSGYWKGRYIYNVDKISSHKICNSLGHSGSRGSIDKF